MLKRKKTHYSLYLCQFCSVHRADNKPISIKCCDLLIVAKVAQWLIWVTEYGRRLLRLPPTFFMGKMLLII